VRALTMKKFFRKLVVFSALAVATSLVLLPMLTFPAAAQSPSPTPTPTPTPSPAPTPTPSPTGSGSSGTSINGLANQRFNQIVTNKVLGSVLLGVNEQINCSDCVSAFGSAGSFSAGFHGRKEITPNLSFLAGVAYTQYGESGYNVTSAPIAAFALRYDFTDWGSSRPFFDIGTILTPFEKVNYSRGYTTNFGNVALQSSTNASEYGVYGRAGWNSRLSPHDELAASIEVWQLWQHVNGYSDPNVAFDPFNASIASGTDRTNLAKIGGQWTHLFGSSIEGNLNGGFVQSFANHSGLVATVTGDGLVVPTIGNQYWFEYGGRIGYRITKGWTADLFVDGTLGPQPVGNTIHGGVGLRLNY
jgi:hypothetical protein